MSSERSAPVVDLALGASRALCLCVTAVTLLAGTAVFASGLSVWFKCLVVAVIVAGALRWLLVEGLRRTPHAVVRLVLMDEEECMLVEHAGAMRSVCLTHAAVITASLAVATLRTGRWRTRTLCIARDAADAEEFRRLRMRLNVASRDGNQVAWRKRWLKSNAGIERRKNV